MSTRKQAGLALPYVAGMAGVLVPVVAFLCIWVSLQAAPWFSWTTNALSDLGVSQATALLFNTGLLVAGVLLAVFAVGARAILPRKASWCLFIASGALMGVGLVPELKSVFAVHWVLSVCFFGCLTGTFLFCGLEASRSMRLLKWSSLGLVALAVSSLGLFAFVSGVAISEVMMLIPGFLWCAGVGVSGLILPARG